MTTQIKPVTIPHEVADAIEYLRKDNGDDDAFSNEGIAHIYVTESYTGRLAISLRKIPFDTLMRALLDGYERELTEEERREKAYAYIRDYYRLSPTSQWLSVNAAIVYVLDALGIKIPEVNA